MTDIFSKFDNEFLNDKLLNDIETSKSGNMEQVEVPVGKYEVKIQKMELTQSKSGKPMFSCWFKIVNECEYKNQILFMNQVIVEGFQFHIVNDILRALESGQEIQFVSFKQYGELIQDIFNTINGNKEYALDYSKNAKGYDSYKIFKAFDLNEIPL